MIELRNICKIYFTKSNKVTALDNINLSFPSSGMHFILGKSGSGKTTLLNILSSCDYPTSGEVLFDNKLVSSFKEKELCELRNSSIGFIFQDFSLIEDLNVYENIALSLELQNKKVTNNDVDVVLKKVGLDGLGKRKINELSGGQKQRVAIARAIIKNPYVILCDEPTGSLDSATSKEIFSLLKEISLNTLVIVVSHDQEASEKYGDRIIELQDGKIISSLYKNEITNKKRKIDVHKHMMSIKARFKLAFINLKKKPIRLLVSLLLIISSITLLGFSSSISINKRNESILDAMMKDNMSYISLNKYQVGKMEEDRYIHQVKMNDSDISLIKEKTKITDYNIIYPFFESEIKNYQENHIPFSNYEIKKINGFVEFNQDDLSLYNFSLLEGHLPETEDEVCITYYQYSLFYVYGYQRFDNIITSPSQKDLLGQILYLYDEETATGKDFIISGIIDTSLNTNRYNEKNLEKNIVSSNEFIFMMETSLHNVVYLQKGYYQNHFQNRNVNELSSYTNYAEIKNDSYDLRFYNIKSIDAFNNRKIYFFDDKVTLQNNEMAFPISLVIPYFDEVFSTYVKKYAFTIYEQYKELLTSYNPSWSSYLDYYDYLVASSYCDEEYILITKDELITNAIRSYDENYNISLLLDKLTFKINGLPYYQTKNIKVTGLYINSLEEEHLLITASSFFNEIKQDLGSIIYDYKYISTPFLNSKKENLSLININLEKIKEDNPSFTKYDEEEIYQYSYFDFSNEYTYSYDAINGTLSSFKNIFSYIGLGLILFSLVFIYYYFSGVILESKKNIGIERAMGAKKKEIFSIFLIQNILLILLIIFFSSISTLFVINLTNSYLITKISSLISVMNFSYKPILLILCTSVLAVIGGTIIPLISILKKNVINILNK